MTDLSNIVVGLDPSGMPVSLPLQTRLTHLLMLGATGSGKSRLLFHYMRQLVKRGEGLLFLDPHGNHPDSDYRNLLLWLSNRDIPVTVIDLSAPSVIGFNPLYCPPGTDPSVIAGNVMDALSVSWDGELFAQKPSIERVLSAVFIALAKMNLTLPRAELLLDRNDDSRLRHYALGHVKDPHTLGVLKHLDDLAADPRRRRDYEQETVPRQHLWRRFEVVI